MRNAGSRHRAKENQAEDASIVFSGGKDFPGYISRLIIIPTQAILEDGVRGVRMLENLFTVY